jgi:gas vesicle protein
MQNPKRIVNRPGARDKTSKNTREEKLMSAPTSATAVEKSETEISNFIEQGSSKRPAQIETDAERIRSSVAKLTSNSIDELEGLTSELQALQEFLNSEVERVQGEIKSALDGIKIIIETIAPWKNTADSLVHSRGGHAVRAGLATNTAARPVRP